MGRLIKIEEKWGTYEEICVLYDTEKESRMKIRLLTIKYGVEGKKSEEIAGLVNMTGTTIRKYMKRWNRRGYAGLRDIPHPDAETKMNEAEMAEINAALKKSPREAGMERSNWPGPLLKKWIAKQFKKEVSRTTSYNILHRLRFSKTRAKKQNKKRDPEAAEKIREELEKIVAGKDEDTIILYEDEAIFTSEPTATSVWTKIGEQPIVQTNSETRKRTVIFGAVNPENGDLYEQFADAGNTVNFQSFLRLLSEETLPKKVILLEDKATYHRFNGIGEWMAENVPNISIVYFPTACSDLNSIELLWKDTRQSVSHNTLFQTFDCLVSNLRNYIAELKLFPIKLMKLFPFIY